MTIIDNLRLFQTHQQRVSNFNSPILTSFDCTKVEPDDRTIRLKEEYVLTGTLSVKFSANPAELERAREVAEKVFLKRLYGDTLGLLLEAEKAVYDGDAKAVLSIINDIRTNLMGD